MRGLAREFRNRLHAGRTGADHADAFAGEIDRFVRPAAGVIDLAAESFCAGNFRLDRHRQAAGGHHAERRFERFAGFARQAPAPRIVLPFHFRDARVELHVAPQIEFVSDVIGVAQDVVLRGEHFRPVPLLLELRREAVRIFEARHVAARAGVTIPVPRAADVRAGFERLHREAEFAEPVHGVHAGETGADDEHVGLIWTSRFSPLDSNEARGIDGVIQSGLDDEAADPDARRSI